MNLAVNARDAMPGVDDIIETADVELDEAMPQPRGSHSRPLVMLAVTDTGAG